MADENGKTPQRPADRYAQQMRESEFLFTGDETIEVPDDAPPVSGQHRLAALRQSDMLLSAGHPMTCNGGNPDLASHHDHEVAMVWTDSHDLRCPECGRIQLMQQYD